VTTLILNADDYAMDGAVDAAILDLAGRGVVTAASAMVLSPSWPEAGRRLLDAPLSRGLHLDFTSPFVAASPLPAALPWLMAAAFAGRLDGPALRRGIDRQLDLFESVAGRPPDFIDGHQHVHQLPLIREALISALGARYGAAARRIGLRICLPRRWRGLKAWIIGAAGARALARLAAAAGHPANTDFAGVYGFSPSADLARLWRGWLTGLAGVHPVVMCHVAHEDASSAAPDPIRRARVVEYRWLGSGAFTDLCAEKGVSPRPWPSTG
jgi:predicted glycoside hydrolase/deacetylase ChbG (UPF0249 family)